MFRRAILRLTVYFSLIQLGVFGALSIAIYLFVTTVFDYDPPQGDTAIATDAAEVSFAALRTGLITGFLVLVVVVPAISFLMARRTLAPVRAAYLAQERFVDDASHEFRTPLSVLSGELELALQRPRSTAEYRAALERSLDTVERMERLTSDLLLLSRGGDRRIRDAFGVVAMKDVVLAALPSRAPAGAPRAAVEFAFESTPVVRGSRELLVRAVGNIVENALKFTPATGAVRIRVAERVGMAIVEVADTGPGFPVGTETRAFDRFWRADTAQSIPGHGLGLAIVKQIVLAHSGRIAVDSSARTGSVVTVELPRLAAR
jgi:signal transduction histidine kinase